MDFTLVTAPATEPLTADETRKHLRLDAEAGEPAPTAPTVALISPAAAGNVDNGAHLYRVTFVTADGETEGGTVSSSVTVADKTVNGKVTVSAIPTGGSLVTSRKLYRTAAGGSTYLLLATIADNTTTTYTDNIADSSLGAGAPTTNTTEDAYVSGLVKTARVWIENTRGLALVTQTWDGSLDAFPYDGPIKIPKYPLSSVTSITYHDDDLSTSTVFSSTKYQVDTYKRPPRIYIKNGESWPTDSLRLSSGVVVRFVAGYGAASAVPEDIKHAIKLLVGQMYAHREPEITGTIVAKLGFTIDALLAPHGLY